MEYSGLGGGILSIPQLRKAFEHIQQIAKKIAAGPIKDDDVALFIKEWKQTFGKSLANKEARAYLDHIKSMGLTGDDKKRTMSKTTRKSRGGQAGGGAALGGAPLDHVTSPGVYGVYGNFPPYVAQGFGIGIPEVSQNRPAIPDPPMTVPDSVGSGAILRGGGGRGKGSRKQRNKKSIAGTRRRKQQGGSNFILRTEPTTVIHDAKTFWQGQPMPTSPSAVDVGPRLELPK